MELPLPPTDPQEIRRVAFLGTPEIGVPTLRALHGAGYEIPLVITGADKRRARGRSTSPTPVKACAIELGLDVSTDVDDLLIVHRAQPIDLAVVVAFGQLIRPHVLLAFPIVNIHFSKLPRWRGAAPVERGLLAGDTMTAVSVMTIDVGLDEGDVWGSVDVPISSDDTVESLWSEMSLVGSNLLLDTMRAGFQDPEPQAGPVRYAAKLSSEDVHLHWNEPAVVLDRVVRVGDAWTTFRGERFKIHKATVVESTHAPGAIDDLVVGTGAGGLQLVTVQPSGKPRMAAHDWANGARPDGEVLGAEPDEHHV